MKQYASKFEEVLGSPELFKEKIREADFEVEMLISQSEEQLANLIALHKEAPSANTNREIFKLRATIETLYGRAERAILRHAMKAQDSLGAELEIFIKSEYIVPIASCIRDGITSPAAISSKLNVRVADVITVLSNEEFQEKLPIFLSQTDSTLSEEARMLVDLSNTLNQIQLERALSAMTEEEISDAEMASLGFNPLIRSVHLAAAAGGKSGLITLEPVSISMEAGSITRRVTHFLPVFDKNLFNAKMAAARRLTELEERGDNSKTHIMRTYTQEAPRQVEDDFNNKL